jgi:MFS family permease
VDRYPKRKVLLFTQAVLGALAVLLGAIVMAGAVQLWMVYAIALGIGLVTTVDMPARQAFVVEMVGKEDLRNAITLYGSEVNVSRVVGPAIAGLVIVLVGLGPCFIINGLSFASLIVALLAMDGSALLPSKPVGREKGQIMDGFRYVFGSAVLRNSLIMIGIIGTLSYEFTVSLPLIAQFTFQGGAETYAELTAAMGVGAIMGGLYFAGKRKTHPSMLVMASLLFGFSLVAASAMPTLPAMCLAMVAVGALSIYLTTLANTIIQLESAPDMLGRVMAFWSIAYFGSTAIGGPLIGWIGEAVGARWGLGVGGIAAILAAGIGAATLSGEPAGPPIPDAVIMVAEETAESDKRIP